MPEFYVGCRELFGQFKVSFHASGNWHIAFTQNCLDDTFPSDSKPTSRFVRKWERPTDLHGVTMAFQIVVPWFSVSILPPVERSQTWAKTRANKINADNILWIAPAEEPRSIVFRVVLTSPDTAVTGWPGRNSLGTNFVGSIRAATGETLWVVSASENVAIPDQYVGPAVKLRSHASAGILVGNLRSIVLARTQDGSLCMYDLPVVVSQCD